MEWEGLREGYIRSFREQEIKKEKGEDERIKGLSYKLGLVGYIDSSH